MYIYENLKKIAKDNIDFQVINFLKKTCKQFACGKSESPLIK